MRTLFQLTMLFTLVMHPVVSAENEECGDTLFPERKGVITSPNFPLPSPHSLSCTYSIDVGRNNSVQLKFLNFDLESPIYADTCIHDWLTITCNETDDENLNFRKRSCGTDPPKTSLWFSNCPVVELNFFADSSVSGGWFSIEYNVLENANLADNISEIDCGDTMFTSSSGFIRLPANPTEYSASVNCNYTISTNNASTFSLGVSSLQLPQILDSLADCDRDYILVGCLSDGETELNRSASKTYCRRSFDSVPVQPSRIVFSNCRMVKISIRSSDYNYQGSSGISFTVSAYDEDCGSTVLSDSTGNVSSPRFPLSYPHSLDCVYFFDVDRTRTVTLDFLSFNLEGLSGAPNQDYCVNTWLTVNCLLDCDTVSDNRDQNSRYCGEKVKPLLLSYSNCDCLTLKFVTNSSASTRGFQFNYEITSLGNATPSTPDKDRSNITLTDSTGFIKSPHYPLSYPHNIDYIYALDVNRTNTVGLYFYSFNVEGTSHTSSMDSCHYDWLMISCLPESWYSYRNRRYCGEKPTPVILSYSNCDSLTLNFVSDSSVTSGGFKIWYTITSAGQSNYGYNFFSGPTGVVISPNFPLPYPSNTNCKYSIDIGRSNSVQLKFKHFELEAPKATGYCANDWLTVTCNETTRANPNNGKKYCGAIQWTSSLRFVDCRSLVLEFISDLQVNHKGFMIEYTVTENPNSTEDNSGLDCGATLFADSSGNISLPKNPTKYLATVNCTYTIAINSVDLIWLSTSYNAMLTLSQSFQDCDTESLMIGCVSEEETELNRSTSHVFCRGRMSSSYHQPTMQLAFADCRILKLSMRSENYDNHETFRITFSSLGPNEVCGNASFSSVTGVVSTMRLPFRYPKRVNCLYTIDSGYVNSVAIGIDRLNFEHAYVVDRNCKFGWLIMSCMVNGTSMAHPLLDRRLCGVSSSITARFSACDRVVLNLTSDYISADRGLTLRYRIGDYELSCGTTLFTNSSGVIRLPINPTNYLATVNCTYTISANDTRYIWINFYLRSLLNSLQDCDTEWLMIGCASEDGAGLHPKTTKVFCHRENPSRWPSYGDASLLFADCRTLKLSIHSRIYDIQEAILINFSVVGPDDICRNMSFSAQTGIISSPQLPFQYPKRVSCLYTIEGGQINSFVVSIDRMRLGDVYDSDGNCNSGWLTITCLVNGTSIAHHLAGRKLCGNKHDPITARFPSCQKVIFNFSNHLISTYSLFTIRYRMGDYELECGATMFTNSSGIISLPKNPTNFPATVNCTYTISTSRMSDIWLVNHFHSLMELLKSFQDCDRESLTIGCVSEGESELNPNTTRVLCRRDGPAFYHSGNRFVFVDCRTLKLTIRSDTYADRQLFRFHFSVYGTNEICGNSSFSAETGIISSPKLPSLYPKRINCIYVIESGHVNSVVLSVDRLNLASVYTSNGFACRNDWLTITCLVNQTSKDHPLADRKLCGRHNPSVTRFPACRSVLLNFSSVYTLPETEFTIRYRIGDYDPECGNTTFSGPNGIIASPQFPLTYPHNLNCLYSITGGQKKAISLSFLSFRLDGRSNMNTRYDDYCYGDWLTVSCLSDEAVMVSTSSSRKYCGIKAAPLTFAFPSCAVVVLNFQSNSYASEGGFNARYSVKDADSVCGSPDYARPSGVINVPWNYADYDGALNCSYVINATEPSSISLTIWSISLQSLVGRNCQRDWLLISCIDGRRSMNLNITHTSCEYLNSSMHLSFPGCTATQVMFHRNVETTGKTFRIEYTVIGYVEDASQNAAVSSSTEILQVTGGTTKCEVGCENSTDGTTCECSTTHSGDFVVTSQMNLNGQRGRAVGVSLTMVLIVVGAISLGAFLLFRRHRKKKQSETLMQENDEDRAQMELESDATKAGSLFKAHRNQDRDTLKYLPLRPISLSDHEEPSTITSLVHDDIQQGL